MIPRRGLRPLSFIMLLKGLNMKQEIMEKLFAEQPLTNEEILLIGSCLGERGKSSEVPEYNHAVKDSLTRACSIAEGDIKSINDIIKSEIVEKKKTLDCDSKQVEVYEKIALTDPKYLRVLMYQFVKMKGTLRKNKIPEPGTITGINLGGGGMSDGFLDFLKGLGK